MTQHYNRNTHPDTIVPDPRVAFFDALAPRWDADCSHPQETLERLETLRPRLGLEPRTSVLELGCGTGQITGWIKSCVAPGRVVAADFSPGMLRQAARRKLNVELRQLDICREGTGPDHFDLVFCFNCFPHFRDPKAALAHIRECLAPSGRLVILHLTNSARLNAFHSGLEGPVHHDRLPGASEWGQLLMDTGLKAEFVQDSEELYLVKARPSEA